MDITVSADTVLPVGKVVQLRPNGKAAPLPLPDLSVAKLVARSSDGYSPANGVIGLRHVKLANDYYLFAVVVTNSSPTNRILLTIAQKNADGTFTKRYELLTSLRCASKGLHLTKVSNSQVIVTYYDGAAYQAVVTVGGTYDSLEVGSPVPLAMSGQTMSTVQSLAVLKETSTKVMYTILYVASVGVYEFNKTSGTITPVMYYNATWQTRSVRDARVYVRRPDSYTDRSRIVIAYACVTSSIHYLSAQILHIVYSPDGESVQSIVSRTPAIDIDSWVDSYNTLTYNAVWASNETIYVWATSGSNLFMSHFKIDWATDTFTRLQLNSTVMSLSPLELWDIIMDSTNNCYFVVARHTASSRLYVFFNGCSYGADVRPSTATMHTIALPNSGTYAAYSISYADGEMFTAYRLSADSPSTIYTVQLSQVSERAIPLGIAKSQTQVTVKGVCNVLANIEVGATYFYDKFGNITRNHSDTYLGMGISPTAIMIDKLLF